MSETAIVDTPAAAKPLAGAVAANGIKLVGETFVPGASLIMDGNIVNGAAHAAAGIGIKLVFGPVGLLLAAADSYSKSVTDKYLWDHVGDLVTKAQESRKAKVAIPPSETAQAAD
ncbi:MAG: DUF6072 family protein [Casimicrobiaceae bacterium]